MNEAGVYMPFNFSKVQKITNLIQKENKPMTELNNQITFDDKNLFASMTTTARTDSKDCWEGLEHWNTNLLADEDELVIVKKFIEFLGDKVTDTSKLFRLNVQNDLTVENVYGPALFKQETEGSDPELIILFGENIIPVEIVGNALKAGQLKGRLIEKNNSDNSKSKGYVLFEDADNEYEFTLPIRTEKKETKYMELKNSLRNPKEFLSLVAKVPKGGGKYSALTSLGECEIAIRHIEKTDTDYGVKFVLELDHDLVCWGNQNLNQLLSKSWSKINNLIDSGKPITLKISDIKKMHASDKLYCSAKILQQAPHPDQEYLIKQAEANNKAEVIDAIPFDMPVKINEPLTVEDF